MPEDLETKLEVKTKTPVQHKISITTMILGAVSAAIAVFLALLSIR